MIQKVLSLLLLALISQTFSITIDTVLTEKTELIRVWYDIINNQYQVAGFYVTNWYNNNSVDVYDTEGTLLSTLTIPAKVNMYNHENTNIYIYGISRHFFDEDSGFEYRIFCSPKSSSRNPSRDYIFDDNGEIVYEYGKDWQSQSTEMREIFSSTGTYVLCNNRVLLKFRDLTGQVALTPNNQSTINRVKMAYSSSNNELRLQRTSANNLKVDIHDLKGRAIYQTDVTPKTNTVQLPTMGSGIYVASVKGKEISQKSIKIHKK